jgi:hypothetical protein
VLKTNIQQKHTLLYKSETESKIIQISAIMGINSSKQNSRITSSTFNLPDDETTISTSVVSFETAPKHIRNPIITNKLLVIWLDANVSNIDDVYQNSINRLRRITSSFRLHHLSMEKKQILPDVQSDKLKGIFTKVEPISDSIKRDNSPYEFIG